VATGSLVMDLIKKQKLLIEILTTNTWGGGRGRIMGIAKLPEAKLSLLSRFAPVCTYR